MTFERFNDREFFNKNTVVEIDVPSGKLIVADNLRGNKHFDLDPKESINYGIGLDMWARDYAEQRNLAYGFVGNTCPSIIKHEDGHLEVVSFDYDEDEDEEVLETLGGDIVANVCTDLWAVMMTDYQNWLDNGGEDLNRDDRPEYAKEYHLIDVVPGKYRWTVYTHHDEFDLHDVDRLTYAELHKIDD